MTDTLAPDLSASHRTSQKQPAEKFDVGSDYGIPDLADLVPAGGRLETDAYTLDNTYYDTASEDLRRLGLVLRRRVGGPDAGWNLQLNSEDGPTVIHKDSKSNQVPRSLAEILTGVRRGQNLVAVASVAAERHLSRLVNATGDVIVEVADDQVHGATIGEASTITGWREVDAEPGVGADARVLKKVRRRLERTGARRSVYRSKLDRALAADSPPPTSVRSGRQRTVGGVVSDYIAAQCVAIFHHDVGLRLDQPVVHPNRVAIRRLRSTLKTFSPLFDAEAAEELDAELVWFASLLGQVRDIDILRARLAHQVAELPGEFVLGPVAADIESILLLERSRHRAAVTEAMNGQRYQQLLQLLEQWRTTPPLTKQSHQPAVSVRQHLVRAERQLDKRLRTAGDDVEALHRARKAGKRYRYANELSVGVIGKKASRTVKTAKSLQELLGEHQDSVISAEFLRTQGAAAGVNPDQNGFTYGLLLAREWARAERIRSTIRKRNRKQNRKR